MSATSRTGTILDRIVEARLAAIEKGKRRFPLAALHMAVKKAEPVRDFAAALSRDAVNVIAELKKASPSRGLLRAEFDAKSLAAGFAGAGAAALSVLTEEEFFQGSIADLRAARKAAAVPVLRKDFIIDPWQVWETRAAEADSFLLIAAILSDAQLRELLALGREKGMEPLVEAHSGEEVSRAINAGARIIGVNNRDLRTFEVRLETALELARMIPPGCIAVAESGIHSVADIGRLRAAGFRGFLIGEHLMQAALPAAALKNLLEPHEHR